MSLEPVENRTWRSRCGQIEVVVEESSSGFSFTGMKVWKAGEHLSELLCAHRALVHGIRVLELGAGCGLVSAVAASLGGDVTATDQLELLPRLQCTSALGTSAQRFHVAQLNWDVDSPPWLPGHFDLILGSDITYVRDWHQGLLQLLWKLVQGHSTTCLLAHSARSPEQTAMLWHELLVHWPGVVWMYDGHDALISCHTPGMRTEAELVDRVLTFALSATAPLEGSDWWPTYAGFLRSNEEYPLKPPEKSHDLFEEGMIGPQQYIPPETSK